MAIFVRNCSAGSAGSGPCQPCQHSQPVSYMSSCWCRSRKCFKAWLWKEHLHEVANWHWLFLVHHHSSIMCLHDEKCCNQLTPSSWLMQCKLEWFTRWYTAFPPSHKRLDVALASVHHGFGNPCGYVGMGLVGRVWDEASTSNPYPCNGFQWVCYIITLLVFFVPPLLATLTFSYSSTWLSNKVSHCFVFLLIKFCVQVYAIGMCWH